MKKLWQIYNWILVKNTVYVLTNNRVVGYFSEKLIRSTARLLGRSEYESSVSFYQILCNICFLIFSNFPKLEKNPIRNLFSFSTEKYVEFVDSYSENLWKTCRELGYRLPEDWPRDGEDLVEKVVSINYDPNRKPMIALTGYDDKLRWQIATSGRIIC